MTSKRTVNIFYLLLAYVILQFIWWGYHIIELTNEVAQMKTGTNLSRRFWMIIGEGGVFFIVLLIGAYYLWKITRKEIYLAKLQKNFLLSVTHELKTPIASAKLNLQTLKSRKLTQEQNNKIILNSMSDVERLNSLVNKILSSANLESKQAVNLLNKEHIKVQKEIKSIIDIIPDNLKVGTTINISIPEELELNFDKELFSSLMMNLIENAIKYSGDNGKILISAFQDKDSFEINVKDNGKGIKNPEKVFQKFYREEEEDTKQTQGTGLGLYIVKQIVLLHKGSISIKNNSPKGTIVQIKLPINE